MSAAAEIIAWILISAGLAIGTPLGIKLWVSDMRGVDYDIDTWIRRMATVVIASGAIIGGVVLLLAQRT